MSESEPDYQARSSMADAKLDDAKARLEQALEVGLDQPAGSHVTEALWHIVEAQSYLRGG
jgi:hypothetical protein